MKFKLVDKIVVEEKRKYHMYTDGTRDIRVYDGDTPPSGFAPGISAKRVAWNKGLTADTDERVANNTQKTHKTRAEHGPYKAWNKGLTKDTDQRVLDNVTKTQNTIKDRYGVDNISQYVSTQPGYKIWNKGLTKDTDDRMRQASENHKGCAAWNKGLNVGGHPQSDETREKIRKAHLSPEFKKQRYEIMKSNGTLFVSDSQAELKYYDELIEKYGKENIIRQYFDISRYPFKCDFYIPSEDLFIEVHGNWTHGGMPYDPNNKECQEKLALWHEKAKTSNYYKNAIYTWTDLDVRKAKIAKDNNLNFLTIYC